MVYPRVEADDMYYKIKEVSETTGISIRMLRHYDKIGLCKPESITPAGYRLYSDRDIKRLKEISFFKKLDFSLEEIKKIIYDPHFDKSKAFELHQQMLIQKKERLEAIIKALENTKDSLDDSLKVKQEIVSAFDFAEIKRNKERYALEIRLKFGNVAVNECGIKTSHYTKEDWTIVLSKADEILESIVRLMDQSPSDPKVQTKIHQFKEYLTNHFWTCSVEVFKTLGQLYVDDPELRGFLEKYHFELPEFMREAILIHCINLEK